MPGFGDTDVFDEVSKLIIPESGDTADIVLMPASGDTDATVSMMVVQRADCILQGYSSLELGTWWSGI